MKQGIIKQTHGTYTINVNSTNCTYSEERIRSWHGRHNLSPHGKARHIRGLTGVADGIGPTSSSADGAPIIYSPG